jgi:HSP20 family protein
MELSGDRSAAARPPETKEIKMKLLPWRGGHPAVLRSELQSWFDDFFDNGRWEDSTLPQNYRGRFLPPINVSENDKEYCATLELPGMEEKDIEVQLIGRMLVVTGERKWEKEKKDRQFHRIESEYGAFRREIELPEGLVMEPDAIRANFQRGLLEITLPKLEPKTAAKIKVQPGK